jgi:hypothetical protein
MLEKIVAPVSAGLLAATAFGQHPLLGDPTAPYHAARDSVYRPLAMQAANGMVLDHTVWNHYFEKDGSPELSSSGYYFLDRIARRASGAPLVVYLQTGRDIGYNPANHKDLDEYRRRLIAYREKLDGERAHAISHYLQTNFPWLPFNVYLVDPAPAGMAGIEAAKAVRDLRDSARGTLPPELLLGIGSYVRSSTGGDGGAGVAPPSPVTSGSGAGPAAFGADAPTGGASAPASSGGPALSPPPDSQ